MITIGETRAIRPTGMYRKVADEAPVFPGRRPQLQIFHATVQADVIFDPDPAGARRLSQGIPVKNYSAGQNVVELQRSGGAYRCGGDGRYIGHHGPSLRWLADGPSCAGREVKAY